MSRRSGRTVLGMLAVALGVIAGLVWVTSPQRTPGSGLCAACGVSEVARDDAGLCCDLHGLDGAFREAWLEHLEYAPGGVSATPYEFLVRCSHGGFRHLRPGEEEADAQQVASRGQLYKVRWGKAASEDLPHPAALALAEEAGLAPEVGDALARIAAKIGPPYYGGPFDRVSDWARVKSTGLVLDYLVVTHVKGENPTMTRVTNSGDAGLTVWTKDRCALSSEFLTRLSRAGLGGERARRLWVQVVFVEDATSAQRLQGMNGTPFAMLYEGPDDVPITGEVAMKVLDLLLAYTETGVWHQPAEPFEFHPFPDRQCARR